MTLCLAAMDARSIRAEDWARSDDAHCIPDMVDVVGGRVLPGTKRRVLGAARPSLMFATCVIV